MAYLNYYPTYEGCVLSCMPQQIKTNESNYNQLIVLQTQDGGIQDGCIDLKMAISQFRLNLERVCFILYGSINPIESVKLPS